MGTTIGVYRIDGVLGRGAMGVVYRATDTKLNRAVAIKFLAADIGDENARWRFQQEAATTTSLNHPHIVTVHDVGEHDGRRYIVSEIVDGGTLEDWLAAPRKHGWRQTVELLVGVADAIATAHAAGVLHRDIKPGNILLDGNGYAKLADFGIAKLVEQQTAATGVGHATARGVVIGTVAYMSPEQASGLPLDSRSDVFSFGVVLYEALAGKRPFEGANDLETLKAIAHVAPPPLSPEIPEQLRNAVERALEKDPADRYQSIRELAIELKRVARRTTETGPRAPMPATGRAGVALWAIGGGIALTALAIAVPWALKLQRQPQRPAEIRYEMPAPNYAPGSENLAISPDGKQLAYLISIDGKEQVYVRPIGSLAGHTIPGADNGTALFWSPDSRALVFLLNGELTRVDLDGDALRALAPASVVAARGSWSHDGTILFSAPPESDGVGVIGSLPASGGRANRLTTVDIANKELFHGYPTFLPDGKHFLYVRQHQPPTPATLFWRASTILQAWRSARPARYRRARRSTSATTMATCYCCATARFSRSGSISAHASSRARRRPSPRTCPRSRYRQPACSPIELASPRSASRASSSGTTAKATGLRSVTHRRTARIHGSRRMTPRSSSTRRAARCARQISGRSMSRARFRLGSRSIRRTRMSACGRSMASRSCSARRGAGRSRT
jgi:hypothetical protein